MLEKLINQLEVTKAYQILVVIDPKRMFLSKGEIDLLTIEKLAKKGYIPHEISKCNT
jgi:hypothetical protein